MLLKKVIFQPPYHLYFLVSIYSLLSSSHSLNIFLMNSCPTPHNLAPSAPISLSLVVLHPAICTFLCDSSHLLFSTFYLPFPLCFHTLFSSIFSPFLLITSKTGLLILLSSEVLLWLSCLPDLHEGSLCCLCCFLSHM